MEMLKGFIFAWLIAFSLATIAVAQNNQTGIMLISNIYIQFILHKGRYTVKVIDSAELNNFDSDLIVIFMLNCHLIMYNSLS